jgi:hypothetical protein
MVDMWKLSDDQERDSGDDDREIRYSLTALGEAVLGELEVRGPRFRGFGPCAAAVSEPFAVRSAARY